MAHGLLQVCPKHSGKVEDTFTLLKACQYLLRVQTWSLFPSETEIGEREEAGQQELPRPACMQEISVRICLSHTSLLNLPQCVQPGSLDIINVL